MTDPDVVADLHAGREWGRLCGAGHAVIAVGIVRAAPGMVVTTVEAAGRTIVRTLGWPLRPSNIERRTSNV